MLCVQFEIVLCPCLGLGALRTHGPLSNRCTGSGMLMHPAVHDDGGLPPVSSALLPEDHSDNTTSSVDHSSPSELLFPSEVRRCVRVLKRIPRAARHVVVTKLAVVLDDVVKNNNIHSWVRLFKFARRCLALPRRGGHRRSLASVVKHQLDDEADPVSRPFPLRPPDPKQLMAKRVSMKLGEGDYKGAVRIVCSEDTIADITDETISALQEKHPGMHPESRIPSPPEEFIPLPDVSEEEVASAIRAFPRGSAGGPDGIRPQHLLDLTSNSAERGGKDLLHALTAFANFVLRGDILQAVKPVFFGATLIPLRKKDGGIRPIAVGQTLRRLVAKCVSSRVTRCLGSEFAPRQLGCGVPLGCEAAAHATRLFLQNMPPGHLLLKLDFKNAFNTLRRDKMLESVKEVAPELFTFIHAAYGQPSLLFCGDCVLESAEGVQQGDPLGPLLFCLTIQPLILKLRSEFSVFYLDDGTIGGQVGDIIHDLQLVEEEASHIGLRLNRAKTELVCDDACTRNAVLSVASELQVTNTGQATLLGTPIGSLGLIDDTITSKINKLTIMEERLLHLPRQDALLILRNSLAIPKLLYILRTAPCFLSAQLEAFDGALKRILSQVLNVDLSQDSTWLQASLPLRAGGLGVRRATQLAPSAYLASAAGCSTLVQQLIPPSVALPDPNIESAISHWSLGHSEPPPSPPDSFQQRVWDAPHVVATYNSLLEQAQDHQTKARLMAVSCSETGAWLSALPVASLGLRMSDDVVRIAAGLRLGVPLCRSHPCISCGADVNVHGTHGLSCRFSKGRHSRHASINDIIKRALESAKVPCHLEPTGLFRSDGKRPDGASIVPWKCGKVLVWDATCPDTLAPSHSSLAVREAGAVAADAEYRKTQKYTHLSSSHNFVPIAVETLGVFGKDAHSFFKEVARRVKLATDDDFAYQSLVQRISVAVQRGNAAAVLGCSGMRGGV